MASGADSLCCRCEGIQNHSHPPFLFPANPLLLHPLKAHVVKLVDTSDLGSDAARYGGSSPSMGTKVGKLVI